MYTQWRLVFPSGATSSNTSVPCCSPTDGRSEAGAGAAARVAAAGARLIVATGTASARRLKAFSEGALAVTDGTWTAGIAGAFCAPGRSTGFIAPFGCGLRLSSPSRRRVAAAENAGSASRSSGNTCSRYQSNERHWSARFVRTSDSIGPSGVSSRASGLYL